MACGHQDINMASGDSPDHRHHMALGGSTGPDFITASYHPFLNTINRREKLSLTGELQRVRIEGIMALEMHQSYF